MNDDFDYGEDGIVFTDQDGNEVEMDLLDMMDYGGETYAFLATADDDDGNGNVYVMRYSEDEDGEDSYFDALEDEDLVDRLFELFKEKNGDRYYFE